MSCKKDFVHLEKHVLPTNYVISIKLDLKELTFEGTASVSVQVHSATNTVILNNVNIVVKSVKYESKNQEFGDGIKVSYSKEDETVTFTFPENLKVGSGTLRMVFTGILNDKLKGFYRSKYTSPTGEEKYAAVTQFEPTGARQAFPCWDEPSIKATFDITLIVPLDRVALSNMPVDKESLLDEDPKWKVLTFKRSPIMSTYLVAFVIGEYDYVEDRDSDGVLVRVYTPLGKKEHGLFALSVATKTLPFYKVYFNIAYPLPKLDLIAIADFGGGAMENWGLITYRETALLIDESNSSSASKQWVALVVGHEIAHQWFGNLVTMVWWTDLWLKEGFASWIEYLCVDHCFPEFDIWTQFATSDFSVALNLDALKNSHPIEVIVGHPSEIEEIFDSISYSKGASIIRMLHDYVGDDDFRKGMDVYLSKYKYSNTTTDDLWAALGKASGKPINDIMNTWTKQMGYPVIDVKQEIKGTSRILTLTQKRFIADGSKDADNQTWLIPISICSASSPSTPIHRFILDKEKDVITLDNINQDDWIKLNVGGVGFYRTHYSADMLQQLLPSIKTKSLSPRDRLALQNDLFALSRAGVTNVVNVLKVAESFENETNYTVWSDLNSNLAGLSVLYQYTDHHDQFKLFLKKLFTPVMKTLGWNAKEGEGPLTAMLRSLVISRLGKCDYEEVVKEAKRRFEDHCSGNAKLPGDLRNAVYSTALSHGSEKELESLLKLYRSTDLQEEKVRILRSLGSVKSPELINRVLEFSLGPEVRSQDTILCILGSTGSAKGREATWKFVKDKWAELSERYKGALFLFPRLIKHTTEHFASKEYAEDVEEFFKKNPAPSAARNIRQSLESIKLNVEQLERDIPQLESFLASYK